VSDACTCGDVLDEHDGPAPGRPDTAHLRHIAFALTGQRLPLSADRVNAAADWIDAVLDADTPMPDGWQSANWRENRHARMQPILVERVPVPRTVKIPWWEAVGRTLPDGRVITQVAADVEAGPFVRCGADTQSVFPLIDADGQVEVLATDADGAE